MMKYKAQPLEAEFAIASAAAVAGMIGRLQSNSSIKVTVRLGRGQVDPGAVN